MSVSVGNRTRMLSITNTGWVLIMVPQGEPGTWYAYVRTCAPAPAAAGLKLPPLTPGPLKMPPLGVAVSGTPAVPRPRQYVACGSAAKLTTGGTLTLMRCWPTPPHGPALGAV